MPAIKSVRLTALALIVVIGWLTYTNRPALAQPKLGETMQGTIAALEKRTGGRIGVSVTDLQSGTNWSYRGSERFPIASTFKAFACAHLLQLSEGGKIDMKKRVRFEANDLETYSPVTKDHVGGDGMSLFELCDAATAMSDNTAANIILRSTGGPEELTSFMRSLGDETTRLDRYEPELNDVGPGEVRDTTSPTAAAESLRKLVLGNSLEETSQSQLEAWLVANKVGGPLLRASLPEGWKIADRTGSGDYGSRGVIAVIWPKNGEASTSGPVVVAVYLTSTTLSLDERSGMIVEIGAAMVKDLQR